MINSKQINTAYPIQENLFSSYLLYLMQKSNHSQKYFINPTKYRFRATGAIKF